MDCDVVARTVKRDNLEAEWLLSNGLNQHQIAALNNRSSSDGSCDAFPVIKNRLKKKNKKYYSFNVQCHLYNADVSM